MLTPTTQAVATDLMKGTLPLQWEKLWDGPTNPTNWIRAINKKGMCVATWVEKAQQGQLLASKLNLSDLIHPETFLNALR
jgi:dynein heavy chain 2, cytosolic